VNSLKKIFDFLFSKGRILIILVFLLGVYHLFKGNYEIGILLLIFYPLFHNVLMELQELNSKIK
jgi:hypothetical protein